MPDFKRTLPQSLLNRITAIAAEPWLDGSSQFRCYVQLFNDVLAHADAHLGLADIDAQGRTTGVFLRSSPDYPSMLGHCPVDETLGADVTSDGYDADLKEAFDRALTARVLLQDPEQTQHVSQDASSRPAAQRQG